MAYEVMTVGETVMVMAVVGPDPDCTVPVMTRPPAFAPVLGMEALKL